MSNLLKPVRVADDFIQEQLIATEYLVKLYERFGLKEDLTHHDFIGKNDDFTRENITTPQWKFLDAILAVWRALYPDEYKIWISELKEELTIERPIREHIKGGGYQPIAYPVRFVDMVKLFFPNLKLQEKSFIKKFVSLFPEFKATKYKI
jgi:hypothetical protein